MTFSLLVIYEKKLQPLSWKLIKGTVEKLHLAKPCKKNFGEMLNLKKDLVRNLISFPFSLDYSKFDVSMLTELVLSELRRQTLGRCYRAINRYS